MDLGSRLKYGERSSKAKDPVAGAAGLEQVADNAFASVTGRTDDKNSGSHGKLCRCDDGIRMEGQMCYSD